MVNLDCPICGCNHYYNVSSGNKPKIRIYSCPHKSLRFKAEDRSKAGELLSFEDELAIAYGIDISKGGNKLQLDFCSFMTTLSSGAIATWIALIGLMLPKNIILNPLQAIFFALPALLFLICVVLFVLAYLPSPADPEIDVLEDLKNDYATIINERSKYIYLGLTTFIIAIFLAILIIIASRSNFVL